MMFCIQLVWWSWRMSFWLQDAFETKDNREKSKNVRHVVCVERTEHGKFHGVGLDSKYKNKTDRMNETKKCFSFAAENIEPVYSAFRKARNCKKFTSYPIWDTVHVSVQTWHVSGRFTSFRGNLRPIISVMVPLRVSNGGAFNRASVRCWKDYAPDIKVDWERME